jgi:hypothetical protein
MVEFYRYPSHVMGGNRGPVLQCQKGTGQLSNDLSHYAAQRQLGFYLHRPPEIVPDERWKKELTVAALADFEKTAGEFNRSLGYE